jgi:hypothetical protein
LLKLRWTGRVDVPMMLIDSDDFLGFDPLTDDGAFGV